MIGRTDIGVGSPTHEGTYAVEVYFGWKFLEWKKGGWWHQGAVGRWTANIPVQWVGPLPGRKGSERVGNPVEQVFDL